MKTQSKKNVSLAVFAFLILLSVFVARPVGKRISSEFSKIVYTIQKAVFDRTSLNVSFESLSPSILSSFNIRGIKLTNEDGSDVAVIKKVHVNYNILRLLKKDYDEIISSVTIDGVDLVSDKLVELFASDASSQGSSFSLNNILDYLKTGFDMNISLNVSVKNVNVSYSHETFDTALNIKKIGVNYSQKRNMLEMTFNSVFSAFLKKSQSRVSGTIGMKGALLKGLEDSSFTLSFSNLQAGNAIFNRFNVLLRYSDDTVYASTVQNTFPLMIECQYGIETKALYATVKTEYLSPSQVISSSRKGDIVSSLKDVKINSDSALSWVNNKLDYLIRANAMVPDKTSYNLLKVDLSGDESRLDVKELSLNGENYEAFLNCDFDFKNLSLSGYAEVPKVMLSNGTVISTEVYFDPLDKGFMAFIPQIFLDTKTFTALQLNVHPGSDSVDFTFEGYDYSHLEDIEPSRLGIEGSYLISSGFVQSSLSINSFYLDSILETAAKFLKPEQAQMIEGYTKTVSPVMISSDAYFSTDFSSFSYNVPYILCANTSKDNQVLMASLNGNELNVSLTDMNLILGKNSYRAQVNFDKDVDGNDFFFTADLNAGSIPYHFTGSFMQNMLHVGGDYDLDMDLNLGGKNGMSGNLIFKSFPVPFCDYIFTASLDSSFVYDSIQGPEITVTSFELDELTQKLSFNPHLMFSGTGTKYGAQLHQIMYSDLYSVLNGNADLFVTMPDSVLEGVGLSVYMKNAVSEENVSMMLNMSNIAHLPLSVNALLHDFYFDCQILFDRLSLNRLTYVSSDNNLLTASLSLTGTLENPYVGLNVDKASAVFNGNLASLSGALFMEDNQVSSDGLTVMYDNALFQVDNFAFSVKDFTTSLSGIVLTEISKETVEMPLSINIYDTVMAQKGLIPEAFTLNVSSPHITGSFMKKTTGFDLNVQKYKDLFTVSSSDNIGLSALYNMATGELMGELNCTDIFTFNASGSVRDNKMNIKLSKVFMDVRNVFSYINYDSDILVYSGLLNGSVTIRGDIDNPEFTGACSVTKIDVSVPTVIPDHITCDKTMITIFHNEIEVIEQNYKIRKNYNLRASAKIFLNKWNFDRVEAKVKSPENHYVPATLIMRLATIQANANVDLDLSYKNRTIGVAGKVNVEKCDARVNINPPKPTSTMNYDAIVDVTLGNHSKLSLEPLLRCVFVPGTALSIRYSDLEDVFNVDGNLKLKSGDISYLNKSFYIKEGDIRFASNGYQGLRNPIVTVQAETREKDNDGDNVRIIMNVQNQYLQEINPRFTSVPPRSENQIMAMLGQFAIGDSSNMTDFLVSAGEYAVNATIGRKMENSLRDFMNFDIFSVRTNVVKNALSFTSSNNQTGKNFSVGNLFDNSTVYIGKYLGSALYIDAMMHLSYNERVSDDMIFHGGLLFQPEIGLEMESPFGNIRWNMAPNLEALMNNQFVPDTSVTLSWKFNF